MAARTSDDGVNQVTARVERELRYHERMAKWDSFSYNGSTVLAIILAGVAAALPWSGDYDWVPRVMSGLAAVLLAFESRLSLSQRWRFHIEMRGAYESILDDIALLPSAEPERSQALDAVRERLDTTRKNEGGIPGGVPQVKRDG